MTHTMHVSDKGRTFISLHEGVALWPYVSSAGKWAIGVGHLITHSELQKWANKELTPHQAGVLLTEDLRPVEGCLRSKIGVSLSQSQFDALASFVFSVGIGAFIESTMLRLLNDSKPIGAEWLKWVHAGGTKLNGLILRRQRERDVYMYDSLTREEQEVVSRFYYA